MPKAAIESARKSSSSVQLKNLDEGKDALANKDPTKTTSRSISESSISSSSGSNETAKSSDGSKSKATQNRVNRSKSSTIAGGDDNTFDVDEQKTQDNMAFSHLG